MNSDETLTVTTVDRSILKLLYLSQDTPISLYWFHEEFDFSPAQLGTFISKFSAIDVVNEQNNEISFTELGKIWLITHRKVIFLSRVKYDWREIPVEMFKLQIHVDSMYLPDWKKMGVNFFEDIFSRIKLLK